MKMIGSPYRCFAVIRRFLQHVLPSGFMNFPKLQLSPANAGTEVSSAAHLLNQRMDKTHPREAERRFVYIGLASVLKLIICAVQNVSCLTFTIPRLESQHQKQC